MGLGFYAVLALTALLYWLPATIAVRRGHPNAVAIFLLNLFLGGTVLGWFGSLIWSVLALKEDEWRKPGRWLMVLLVIGWIAGFLIVLLIALRASVYRPSFLNLDTVIL